MLKVKNLTFEVNEEGKMCIRDRKLMEGMTAGAVKG